MFDLTTAFYHNNYWFDDNGNRITESEYNKILSASTWGEIDPNDLILDDDGADLNFYPEDMTFAEYVSGIKF